MAKKKRTQKKKKKTPKGKLDVLNIVKAKSRELLVLPPNKKEIDRKKQGNKNDCRGKVDY